MLLYCFFLGFSHLFHPRIEICDRHISVRPRYEVKCVRVSVHMRERSIRAAQPAKVVFFVLRHPSWALITGDMLWQFQIKQLFFVNFVSVSIHTIEFIVEVAPFKSSLL